MKYLMLVGLAVLILLSGLVIYCIDAQKNYDPYCDVGPAWDGGDDLNLSIEDCKKAYACRYAFNYDMPAFDLGCSNQTYVMDLVDVCIGASYK